jgi:hypothetical protein
MINKECVLQQKKICNQRRQNHWDTAIIEWKGFKIWSKHQVKRKNNREFVLRGNVVRLVFSLDRLIHFGLPYWDFLVSGLCLMGLREIPGS